MLFEVEFIEICKRCQGASMVDIDRLYNLYRATRHVVEQNVPGALVECGVWRGGCAMVMAFVAKARTGCQRDIYLYDTYAGMTEPTTFDVKLNGMPAADKWREQQRDSHNDWCYAPLELVWENMRKTGYDEEKLHFVKGPVEETIPETMPEQIAVLRLDTDFYASTLHELEHLYPRLVTGGVIIFDDYNHWKGQRQAVHEYFKKHGIGMLLTNVTTSVVGVKVEPYGSVSAAAPAAAEPTAAVA